MKTVEVCVGTTDAEFASAVRCRQCRHPLSVHAQHRGVCYICDKSDAKPVSFTPRDRAVMDCIRRGINVLRDIAQSTGLSSKEVFDSGRKLRRAGIIATQGRACLARWHVTDYGRTQG